jgi:hypothetical protein
VSDSDSLDLSTALTFSVWLYKQDAGTGGWAVVFSKGNTSALDSKSPYCLAHSYDGKSPSICLVKNNYREMIGTTAKTNFSEWYLLTVTWDGADIDYYINGELKDTKEWVGTLPNSNSKLLIGSDPPGVTEYFRGVMDDLRIYDRALSEDEIKALYVGKESPAPSPKPVEIVKIVKLFTAKSVYPRGEKVDVHYYIKNTGTVDVDEYHVEYDIIDVTGKTVYKNAGGAHSISAGDENKWHSEKWEIPSDAEYGSCTIEARLKWDSETDTETTDFLVTHATRAKDKTAELEITELYTSKFEYSRGEAIKLCYRIKNVGTTDAEYHLCNIIKEEGEKVYWFIFSTHNIAAGEEQKRCATGCWKIPSDAKCGTYTIETTLVWDSKTAEKETSFIVK